MYGRFLKTLNGRLVNGIYDGQQFTIVLMPFKIPLIQMRHHSSSDLTQRVILNITGGWLAITKWTYSTYGVSTFRG
ncbi:hypothetical protein AAHB43_01350 [Staphylococcus pseudintermedius]